MVRGLQQLFHCCYGHQAPSQVVPPAVDAEAAKTTLWPGRIPPVTDTKMIVDWNSLAISGLARAAQVFENRHYYQLAARAAQFIYCAQRPNNGTMLRLNYGAHGDDPPLSATVPAKAEDYALYVKALLDVQQAALSHAPEDSQQWLDWAVDIQAEMTDMLWDDESGGFFVAATIHSDELIIREKDYRDNATPAANGVAIANLIRLSALTGDLSFSDRAYNALQAFSRVIAEYPRACPTLLTAIDLWYNQLTVKGPATTLSTLTPAFWPTAVFSAEALAASSGIGMACLGTQCLPPASDIDSLILQMRTGHCRIK